MTKLNCPHCGNPTISILRKMCLGPAIPTTCKACGKKVGVPYIAILAIIPLFLAILISTFVVSPAFKIAIWIAGGVIMGIIYIKWVPLRTK